MAEKNTPRKIKSEAKKTTEKILKFIDIDATVDIEVQEDLIKVNIEGEDLGLLIGYRGENIESLQLIMGIILNKNLSFENWRPVLVDVGGWRKQRDESLRILISKEVEKISEEEPSVELPPMPPSQRRSVHIFVGEYDDLTTESVGEGANRHVVIRKS